MRKNVNPERERVTEQKDIGQRLDFRRIFYDKLASLPVYESEQEMKDAAYGYEGVGIMKIKKQGPALIFVCSNDEGPDWNYQIWLENPVDIGDHRYPHTEVEDKLTKYLQGINLEIKIQLSAFVLQDDKDRIYIVLDSIPASRIKEDMESQYSEIGRNSWIRFLDQYHIERIVGNFPHKYDEPDGSPVYDWNTERLVDSDIISEIKDDNYLYGFAEEHQMTNTQWLRFRRLAKSLRHRQKLNLDKLAKAVIEDD